MFYVFFFRVKILHCFRYFTNISLSIYDLNYDYTKLNTGHFFKFLIGLKLPIELVSVLKLYFFPISINYAFFLLNSVRY